MSQLLEVFGIVFESDAEDVTRGAEEATQSAEQLEQQISSTDSATTELGGSFLDLIGTAQTALASVLSLGALTGGVIVAAQLTDEVGKFSQTLGLNIQDVQAWSEAVVRSGGSANGFQSSIGGLTRGLTDFAVTGGGTLAETFARIGVSATDANGKIKTAFDILPELADQFEKLTAAEATGFGERLGLDQGTILLLQQGRRAVDDLVERQKALGVATQEDYEIAARFNDQWADTKQVFQSLFTSAGSTILPLLTSVLSGVEKVVFFLAKHKALVTGFFIGIAAVATAVFGPAIAAAVVAVTAAAAPFLLMAAAAGAVGLAIGLIADDISNFIAGNDSLIGSLAETYPNIGRLVGLVTEGVKFLVGALGEAYDAFLSLTGSVDVFDLLGKSVTALFETFDKLLGIAFNLGEVISLAFTNPQKAIEKLLSMIKELGASISEALPDFSGALDDAAGFFGFGGDEKDKGEIESNLNKAKNFLFGVDSNPLNTQTSGSISTSSRSNSRQTSVSIGQVSVQTQSTDAAGMAAAASGELSSQMRQAVNTIDDGVAY